MFDFLECRHFVIFVAEKKDCEKTGRNSQGQKDIRKPLVGHIDTARDDNGRKVYGRGRRSDGSDHRNDGSNLQIRDLADAQNDNRHESRA